jgi:exopolysaccharide production protein ExoQ
LLKEKHNPVRYSVFLLLLLTACLYFTQNYPPAVVHLGFDPNDLIDEASGNLTRQLAFLTLGFVGALGIYYAQTHKPKEGALSAYPLDRRMLVPMVMLLGWCLLSVFWSDMKAVSAKRLLVVGLTFVSATGLALSWTRTQILRFIALSSSMYLTVGVVLEVKEGFFHPAAGDYRFCGTLTPNEQGYLCMAIVLSCICMARTLARVRRSGVLYYLLAGYGSIFMLLTRCRGALVALVFAALLYFLVVFDVKNKVLAVLLLCTAGAVLAVSGSLPAVTNALDRGGEGSSNFTGRGPLWDELMTYVDQKPWLGRGYESFWTATTIDDLYRHQHWPINSAHSEYIESMLTIGIIGMVLHTVLLIMGMVEGVRLFGKKEDMVYFLAAALCLIYLTGGFLEVLLIIKPSILSFYLTLLLCAVVLSPPEIETAPSEQLAQLQMLTLSHQ